MGLWLYTSTIKMAKIGRARDPSPQGDYAPVSMVTLLITLIDFLRVSFLKRCLLQLYISVRIDQILSLIFYQHFSTPYFGFMMALLSFNLS